MGMPASKSKKDGKYYDIVIFQRRFSKNPGRCGIDCMTKHRRYRPLAGLPCGGLFISWAIGLYGQKGTTSKSGNNSGKEKKKRLKGGMEGG